MHGDFNSQMRIADGREAVYYISPYFLILRQLKLNFCIMAL